MVEKNGESTPRMFVLETAWCHLSIPFWHPTSGPPLGRSLRPLRSLRREASGEGDLAEAQGTKESDVKYSTDLKAGIRGTLPDPKWMRLSMRAWNWWT